jgi:hypothetical protein
MALSKRGVVGREIKKIQLKHYLLIKNTFVRKALAASMNSFRERPCKHNRVFMRRLIPIYFYTKTFFLCMLLKGLFSKPTF